jgi:Na+/H+ antiporter NhaD/arsenite permease-like protein
MLEICGFFEFVAIKATKLSKGDPWMLIVYLGTFTTLISIVIDNVTAIILIAPITIKICDKIKISAIPPLIAEAILSDTGGVATLVGDPPNVMIASFTASSGTAFTFNSFISHLTPLTFFAWVITLGYMRYYYRDWRETKPKNIEEVLLEDEWAAVNDKSMMTKTLLTLAGTIILFSLHELVLNPRDIHIEISAIALGGAGIAMALSLPDIHAVIEKVEWTALIFFAGLFVMVGGLEHVGHLESVASWIFGNFGPDGSISNNPMILAVVMIWVAAIASAIVDNIPFCAAMLPIIHKLGELSEDVNVIPLYWALAMGCGFGGNATPIGSSANVMTVSISEKGGHKITTAEWIRVGLPVMFLTCCVATVFMVLFYDSLYVNP